MIKYDRFCSCIVARSILHLLKQFRCENKSTFAKFTKLVRHFFIPSDSRINWTNQKWSKKRQVSIYGIIPINYTEMRTNMIRNSYYEL